MDFSGLPFWLIICIVIATLYLTVVMLRHRKKYTDSIKNLVEYEQHYQDAEDGYTPLNDPNIPPEGIYNDELSPVKTPQITNTGWNEQNFRQAKFVQNSKWKRTLFIILFYLLVAAALIYIYVFFNYLTPSQTSVIALFCACSVLPVVFIPSSWLAKHPTAALALSFPLCLVGFILQNIYFPSINADKNFTDAEFALWLTLVPLSIVCKAYMDPNYKPPVFVKNLFKNPTEQAANTEELPTWVSWLLILLAMGVLIAILTGIFHFSTLFPPPPHAR